MTRDWRVLRDFRLAAALQVRSDASGFQYVRGAGGADDLSTARLRVNVGIGGQILRE